MCILSFIVSWPLGPLALTITPSIARSLDEDLFLFAADISEDENIIPDEEEMVQGTDQIDLHHHGHKHKHEFMFVLKNVVVKWEYKLQNIPN